MMAELTGPTLPRDFSRVVITLDNVLYPEEKLRETPSTKDGIDKETELDLRFLGCELIQTAGILLKLPQVAMASGQVCFQRFYYSKSFVKHNMEILAMACINLAARVEESPRRIRDVINVFHHIKQVRGRRNISSMNLDHHYINLKNQVIKAERRILKELGFCVHVKHPHKIVVSYLQILDKVDNHKLLQSAWNIMNDSLRTDVFLRYTPEAVACTCIFLAARLVQVPLPTKPGWYLLFNVDLPTIESICMAILRMYNRPKPNFEKLEKIVEEAKKKQLEEKVKAKEELGSRNGTPHNFSGVDSPKVNSPNPAKKVKAERDEERRSENGSYDDKNGSNKKRRHSDSDGSFSRSRSVSRSFSRSRSRSRSPHKKKRRSYSPRHKKDRYYDDDYYYKEKRSHKKKRHRSRSSSLTPPPRYSSKSGKKYKEKRRSLTPEKYVKDKRRSPITPDKSHRSRKHRNGHRDSSPAARDYKYDKYRR